MELERRGAQRWRRGYAEDVYPELSERIIRCAMKVHDAFGPGMLESAYEECMCHALAKAGLGFRRQVAIPVAFEGVNLDCGFRMDLLVEEKAVVEIKAVDQLLAVHDSQLLTYLKLARIPLGLVINFNVAHLRNGIHRKVFTYSL